MSDLITKILNWRNGIQDLVGTNAKGRISKRVFQENKARQIFRITNISYPLIRTRMCFCLITKELMQIKMASPLQSKSSLSGLWKPFIKNGAGE